MGNPSVHFTGLAVLVHTISERTNRRGDFVEVAWHYSVRATTHGQKNLNQKLHCFTPPGSAAKFLQTLQSGQTIYRKRSEMILGKVDLIFIGIDLGNEVFSLKEQNESKSNLSIYSSIPPSILQESNNTFMQVKIHRETNAFFLSFFVIKMKEDPCWDEVLRPECFDSNRRNYVFPSQNLPSLPAIS